MLRPAGSAVTMNEPSWETVYPKKLVVRLNGAAKTGNPAVGVSVWAAAPSVRPRRADGPSRGAPEPGRR